MSDHLSPNVRMQSSTVSPESRRGDAMSDHSSPVFSGTSRPVWDITAALPEGILSVEAAAGTGKTYAIAAMATRFLAEGRILPSQLAVITFSRNSAGELDQRLRLALQDAATLLAQKIADPSFQPAAADKLAAVLLDADQNELRLRYERIVTASRDIRQATIATIHEFCSLMLQELGVLACVDGTARLAGDTSELGRQAIVDTYLQRYANRTAPFDLAVATDIGLAAITNPTLELVPTAGDDNIAERVSFAAQIRTLFSERKKAAGIYDFDDQLSRLREAVRGNLTAQQRIADRARVVFVDEFQDTDQVQWEILRDCFENRSTLILIGDPKQAVYGFRGGDIETYLQARNQADSVVSLTTNYRADPGVVSGVNELFTNTLLGAQITAEPMTAIRQNSRLQASGEWEHAVRIRCLDTPGTVPAAVARERIATDLIRQITTAVSSGFLLTEGDTQRPLSFSDFAILVRTNKRGREIAETLAAAEIPVAFLGADCVFATPAATAWLHLLTALNDPKRSNLRRAMLTDFIGADIGSLAVSTESELAALNVRLYEWSQLLAENGIAALAAKIFDTKEFTERILRRHLGERDYCDYRHIAQLLGRQSQEGCIGSDLVSWLAAQVASPYATSDTTRRLDTDLNAVKIMTIHRAKGLQFPIVFLPQAADFWQNDSENGTSFAFHVAGTRVLDVGGANAPGRKGRLLARQAADLGEELRAFYVAMTRAQSHLVMWWAKTYNTGSSALQRLLFKDHDQLSIPQASYPATESGSNKDLGNIPWLQAIHVEKITARSTTGASVFAANARDVSANVLEAPAGAQEVTTNTQETSSQQPELTLANFEPNINQTWKRTSYSGLTAQIHDSYAPEYPGSDEPPPNEDDTAAVAISAVITTAETTSATTTDMPVIAATETSAIATAETQSADMLSPLADFPAGTMFGTLVHSCFEKLDWFSTSAAQLLKRLDEVCAAALEAAPLPGVSPTALAQALLPALQTPLGELASGRSLSQIPITDRLPELDFEYPLAQGDHFPYLADIAKLFEKYLAPSDPLADYAEYLKDPALASQPLHGFLTGSIDAVLRVDSRYLILDYKTNRIQNGTLPLVAEYSSEAMAAEMIRSHYPLQAICYAVALHRFLTLRLPGYDPDTHLGGIGYLFVRGMSGKQADPVFPTGVFSWRPPTQLVITTSELLGDEVR